MPADRAVPCIFQKGAQHKGLFLQHLGPLPLASFQQPMISLIHLTLCLQVVMEYCGGGNAWELTDDRSFEIKEEHVATILEAVLKGLVFLEENCILHRDIKPDNILFTSDGHVKLSTFSPSSPLRSLFC